VPSGAAICFGVVEVAASLARSPTVYGFFLLLLGGLFSVYTISTVALVNNILSPAERRNVLVYYNSAVIGCVPFGTLLVGELETLGTNWTLVVPGLLIVGGGCFVGLRDRVRRVPPATVQLCREQQA
jgi:hypothetical protein